MEDKDLKYKKILDRLQKTDPVLNDAGGLTDSIMQKVEKMAVGEGRIRLMRISGMLSGVAASVLICLFAYETLNYPVSPVENYSRSKQSYTSYTSYELSVSDKEKIIEKVVKSREAQRAQKERLSAAFIAHSKIAKQYHH